jgi:cell division cycle 20-like protein 1 (cofactor of APC complex)
MESESSFEDQNEERNNCNLDYSLNLIHIKQITSLKSTGRKSSKIIRKSLFASKSSSVRYEIPTPKKAVIYSDRFIPIRSTNEKIVSPTLNELESAPDHNSTYNTIIRNELFGKSGDLSLDSSNRLNILKHRSPTKHSENSPYSLSPISEESQKLLIASKALAPRKISKYPFKILEAPCIQDDFYLNLVDWSSQNVLAVALKDSVYLLNIGTSCITKLFSAPDEELVTSVSWADHGQLLAVGTGRGLVHIWDVPSSKCVRSMIGHKSRVSALSWNASGVVSSGARDRNIYDRDIRQNQDYFLKRSGHKQEVCGLKWSLDGQFLASGGNDNKLIIWDPAAASPLLHFSNHSAAVKALSWSPHQRGLLASGGGTADRCIKFWNISTGSCIQSLDTGSQVCNLIWSKNVNELVSTHGFSQNQIIVWAYPSMTAIATLIGHSMRVLYLSMSPDCQTIVTGAGDETLRFWNVFPKVINEGKSGILSNQLIQIR